MAVRHNEYILATRLHWILNDETVKILDTTGRELEFQYTVRITLWQFQKKAGVHYYRCNKYQKFSSQKDAAMLFQNSLYPVFHQ